MCNYWTRKGSPIATKVAAVVVAAAVYTHRGARRHPGDAKYVTEILGRAKIRKLGDKV